MVAVETTKFGWILSGCVAVSGKTKSVNFVSSATSEARIGGENEELESQVKRFWELESLGINKYEQSFYEEYLNTICRNEYNRYEVRLPFKENHPLILDNFELCKRRLLNLHQKLEDNLLRTIPWNNSRSNEPRKARRNPLYVKSPCYPR